MNDSIGQNAEGFDNTVIENPKLHTHELRPILEKVIDKTGIGLDRLVNNMHIYTDFNEGILTIFLKEPVNSIVKIVVAFDPETKAFLTLTKHKAVLNADTQETHLIVEGHSDLTETVETTAASGEAAEC